MMIKKAKRKHYLTKTQRLHGSHPADLEGEDLQGGNDGHAAGPWPRQRISTCQGHERIRHMSQSGKWKANVARASRVPARVTRSHRGAGGGHTTRVRLLIITWDLTIKTASVVLLYIHQTLFKRKY